MTEDIINMCCKRDGEGERICIHIIFDTTLIPLLPVKKMIIWYEFVNKNNLYVLK